MIVVTIELWPKGREESKKLLGKMIISNDGTGDARYGNYDITLMDSGPYVERKRVWRAGKVFRYLRTLSVYHLVHLALKATL